MQIRRERGWQAASAADGVKDHAGRVSAVTVAAGVEQLTQVCGLSGPEMRGRRLRVGGAAQVRNGPAAGSAMAARIAVQSRCWLETRLGESLFSFKRCPLITGSRRFAYILNPI